MKYFVYTEQHGTRQLMCVDEPTMALSAKTAATFGHVVSNATFKEGRTNGETYVMMYLTPAALSMQDKILLQDEFMPYLDTMQQSDRIHLRAKG